MSILNLLRQWKKRYFQITDFSLLNFEPSQALDMKKTSDLLGISEEELSKLTFSNVLSLFRANDQLGRARFIPGIRQEQYYCPLCLKHEAYYKLIWDIKGIDICYKHNIKLESTCPKCRKVMKRKDITQVELCPYCKSELSSHNSSVPSLQELQSNYWYYHCWERLCRIDEKHNIQPQETAIRLLYLLNDMEPSFDRERVKANLSETVNLSTLLQQARNTLSQSRAIHINTIIIILKSCNTPIDEFIKLVVPDPFKASIGETRKLIIENIACQAPWCRNYQMEGKLIKTGTSLKQKKNGQKLLYYLICPECYCEYAFNESRQLRERTYFIESYNTFIKYPPHELSIKKIFRMSGLSEDRIKRSLAYFSGRNLFCKPFNTNQVKMAKLIDAVHLGTKIKEIEEWTRWESYREFLYYRFHPQVMIAIQEDHKSDKKKSPPFTEGRIAVLQTIEEMKTKDEDISLKSVIHKLNVCSETIRNWGCNDLISRAKKEQKKIRETKRRERIYLIVEDFLQNKDGIRVTVPEIYNILGTQRTVLWRSEPELTKHINQRIMLHNRKIEKFI